MTSTPPLLPGALPLLGHALKFKQNRLGLFQEGFDRLGKAFTLKLGTQKAAVLVGPEHATLFFKETDQKLDMAKPYGFLREAIGNVAFLADHSTYLNQKPTLYAPFLKEKMLRYPSIMQDVVQTWLDDLPDEGRMDISLEMLNLVQQVAGYCFGGKRFMEIAGEEFWNDFGAIGKALDPLIPANWPLPKNIRRKRAKKRMNALLQKVITDRRRNPDLYDDVLQDMINTPFSDGKEPDDETLISLTHALMFAGHETTAGQAAWTLIQLLQNPVYLRDVEEEIGEKFPYHVRMDLKTLIGMKKCRWAVDETTRMHPSVDLMIRVTEEPLEVGDYTIPAGWPVFIAVEVGGYMEEVFEHPHQYDPYRFGPGRNEHKKNRNSVAGWGGGVHKCAGMSFAQNEMQIITTLFLQQFHLSLETAEPGTVRDLGACRPGPAWVRFKRKSEEELVTTRQAEAAAEAGCPHMAKLLADKA